MLVERACSSSPPVLRPVFFVRLLAAVFGAATLWFLCHPDGACREPAVAPRAAPPARAVPAAIPTASSAVEVVDVAALAVTPALVAQLVRLRDGERITSVDDQATGSTLEAGTLIAARVSRITARARGRLSDASDLYGSGGEYIDLAVEGDAGGRRVLVLFH